MAEQQTDARRAAVDHLTTRFTAQALASVIVDALAVAGTERIWDGDTADRMAAILDVVSPARLGHGDIAYWRSVTGEED